MKGIIFTTFNNLVEEKFGLKTWDEILNTEKPESGGAYTSSETYPDKELFGLVGALSKISGESVDNLIFAFGEYTLLALSKAYSHPWLPKNAQSYLSEAVSCMNCRFSYGLNFVFVSCYSHLDCTKYSRRSLIVR